MSVEEEKKADEEGEEEIQLRLSACSQHPPAVGEQDEELEHFLAVSLVRPQHQQRHADADHEQRADRLAHPARLAVGWPIMYPVHQTERQL